MNAVRDFILRVLDKVQKFFEGPKASVPVYKGDSVSDYSSEAPVDYDKAVGLPLKTRKPRKKSVKTTKGRKV